MDSALDSTNPQNPHKKYKMDGCVVWLIKLVREGRFYFWDKPKVAKDFRFCFAESRGKRRICGVDSVSLDSGFYGFAFCVRDSCANRVDSAISHLVRDCF